MTPSEQQVPSYPQFFCRTYNIFILTCGYNILTFNLGIVTNEKCN